MLPLPETNIRQAAPDLQLAYPRTLLSKVVGDLKQATRNFPLEVQHKVNFRHAHLESRLVAQEGQIRRNLR